MVDHWTPGSTIFPAFSTLGLMGMSLVFRPRWMVLAVLLFSLVVAGVFFKPALHLFLNGNPLNRDHIEFASYARTVTFFLLGCFCVLFSSLLEHFRNSHIEMHELISRFPYPLIISAQNGEITYANRVAKERFYLEGKEGTGVDFTRLFAPKNRQNDFYCDYLDRFVGRDRFKDHLDDSRIMQLEFEGKPLKGDTLMLVSKRRKQLLTMFLESFRN
jgi:hypothetical protein